MHLERIIQQTGINAIQTDPVAGGDINAAFRLQTTNGSYFLKINDANLYPGMFEAEAAGLAALAAESELRVPPVIDVGISDGWQYLLLQWIEKKPMQKNTWHQFGHQLAAMHRRPQTAFGWPADNYIGSLQQVNTIHYTWADFYAGCRIMPLIDKLYTAAVLDQADLLHATALCEKLDQLFPVEPPALLHGDLWSGNFMITEGGAVAIFDPAVYHGHREMDIAMSKLFGGFDDAFYQAYQELYPLQRGWQQRLRLAQLYPLLVHAILFRGHYVYEVKEILKYYTG